MKLTCTGVYPIGGNAVRAIFTLDASNRTELVDNALLDVTLNGPEAAGLFVTGHSYDCTLDTETPAAAQDVAETV